MTLVRTVYSRAIVRAAVLLIRTGWAMIHSQERRHGLLPISSTEPTGAWLEVPWE